MTYSVWGTRSGMGMVAVAVVLAFLAFPFAAYSTWVTLQERDKRAELVVSIAKQNQLRLERACLRTGAIVKAIDRIAVANGKEEQRLQRELERINRMFPDLPSCPVGGGR